MPRTRQASTTQSGRESTEKATIYVEESSDSEPEALVTAKEFRSWKQPVTVDQLISALSFHPRGVRNMSLKAPKPVKSTQLKRKVQSSSLGNLDRVPLEILHHILRYADLSAVARIKQVSVLGKQIIDSLPPYQALMKYARSALGALGATGLAGQHSLGALEAAFRAPNDCISCGEEAPFLLMPTLERCCYECLVRNPALQCIPTHLAVEAFGLYMSQVSSLPMVNTIPEHEYPLATPSYQKGRLLLVNTRAAKLLGLSVHGSEEELARQMPGKPREEQAGYPTFKELGSRDKWFTMRRAQAAPLAPLGQNPSMQPLRDEWKGKSHFGAYGGAEDHFEDAYSGMATIRFPSLQSNNEPERLYWCRGCAFLFSYWDDKPYGYNPAMTPRDAPPPGVTYRDFELGKARRAHTKEHFIEHLRRCQGARLQIVGFIKPSSKLKSRVASGGEMIRNAINNPRS